jgi:hypothetical protein
MSTEEITMPPVTLDWVTYSKIMNDRYMDGRIQTRNAIISKLRDKYEATDMQEPEWIGLQLAIDIALEARW